VIVAIVHAVEDLASTPWVYMALFGIAMFDAFFPVVPSETLVITLGPSPAPSGEPYLALVMEAPMVDGLGR
jgi:membrane-associated protein